MEGGTRRRRMYLDPVYRIMDDSSLRLLEEEWRKRKKDDDDDKLKV